MVPELCALVTQGATGYLKYCFFSQCMCIILSNYSFEWLLRC